MKKFLTKTFWILLIIAAVYGGYYYYFREEPASLARTKENIFDFMTKTAKNVDESFQKKAEKKKEELLESAGESTKDYLREKAAEVVFQAGEKIQSLAGDISGEDANQPGNPPTVIVMKKDAPLSISIQGSSYSVDWGDGKEERNTLLNGQKLISHNWSTTGDYLVKIEVTNNGAVHLDSFPVRVISP